MGRRDVWSHRVALAAGLLSLAGVLVVRGLSPAMLLVAAVGLLLLAALGLILRAAMPASARYVVTAGSLAGALWPWTLPLRRIDGGRSVDVLPLLVKDIGGVEHRCEVRGRLASRGFGEGTQVEVFGRRLRDGTVRVRQLVDVTSGEATRPRAGIAVGTTRVASAAVSVVLVAATIWSMWHLVFA